MSNRKIMAAVVAVALAALAPATFAQAPQDHPYDGTGSRYTPIPGDQSGPAKSAKRREEDEAQRASVGKSAMGGRRPNDMVDYAGLLEQGNVDHAPDLAGALDLYENAADLGNKTAIRRMAIAYMLGEGRPVNLTKAFAYSDKLSDKEAVALFGAGYDYENGVSGPKDQGHAIAAYMLAAKAGSGDAMDAIGRLALGQGHPDVARSWFRRGVFFGSADAMDHLAVMTEAGQGGSVDKALAYWLYVNAARRGNVHAGAWVAAQNPTPEPLPVADLREGAKEMAITRSYGTPGHMHSEPLNPAALGSMLQGHYPSEALDSHVDGRATIHCYVNAAHEVDACIIEREFPIGYDFGQILGELYEGQLTVADTDAAGRPTANTVFALTLAWRFE